MIGPKRIRKFRLRAQYQVNKAGVASVKLVSSRKILSKGKSITAGQAVGPSNKLSQVVAKAKVKTAGKRTG